ncbi:FAD-binding protein [Pseudomonas sp. LRF_L74]|uniref:FAD-binding oxidoreductase n=1 Tax=Pseudomonas sp. LRF_L74 TaxID=3369422 RepID=UPI003F62F684
MNEYTHLSDSDLQTWVAELRRAVGSENVYTDLGRRATYGFDAYFKRAIPKLVVAPATTHETAKVVRVLAKSGLRFVVRGRGTGYAGGSVPINGEVLILTTRLSRIREVNVEERWVVAEAGVITADIQRTIARHNLRYPVDPSSHAISTIGGNVATNAGGPHCLGHGVTSNYVLELECISATGEIFYLGNSAALSNGLDLRGVVVGSEGTTVIVTSVKLRLIPKAEAIRTIYARFDRSEQAFSVLANIFSEGLQPIALDMTANVIHPQAAEFPFKNDAILYIEIEGDQASVEKRSQRLKDVLSHHPCAVSMQNKNDLMKQRFSVTQERWIGITQKLRLPAYFLFDAVVCRSRLPEIFAAVKIEAERFNFVVANTFHAGDGNIHPTAFFDPRSHGIEQRLEAFRDNVLAHVEALEGVLSGEHGIGLEKKHLISRFFDLGAQQLQRGIIAAFQSDQSLGADKLLPNQVEAGRYTPRSKLRTPGLQLIDGYAVFPAVTTLVEVRADLANTPYQFAYEPLGTSENEAIGKIVSSGAPGLREDRFGPARDLLLGGVLKSPKGTCYEFGSVYAKDVSGLDIRKLLFGSRERLGTLQTVVLKLTPRDERSVLCELLANDMKDAQSKISELSQSSACVSALHILRTNKVCRVRWLVEGLATTVDAIVKSFGERYHVARFSLSPWEQTIVLPKSLTEPPIHWRIAPLRDVGGIAGDADFIALYRSGLLGIGGAMTPIEDDLPAITSHIEEIAHAI